MKSWVSVVLICSFLRLHLVCCCGAVGLCDRHLGVCARDEAGPHRRSSAAHEAPKPKHEGREAVVKVAKCRCHHHDSLALQSELNRQQIALSPACEECHRPRGEDGHHHLYLLVHGNSLPSEKSPLKNSSVSKSSPHLFAYYPRVWDQRDCLYHLASSHRVDLLLLLGQRRI